MSDLAGAILRVAVALPIVLIIAYLSIRYGFMNKGRFFTGGNMKVLDQVSLGPKTKVCVVKVGEQYYLLGCSEQQVTLLKELDSYQMPDGTRGEFANPWQDLNRWLNRRREKGKDRNQHERY